MTMTDFMTAERRARLLGDWERRVAEYPYEAYQAGPPNWLVLEEWKGKNVEALQAAAERVRARYFPGGFDEARVRNLRETVKTDTGKWILRSWGWDTDRLFGESSQRPKRIVTKEESSQTIVTDVEEIVTRACEVCGGSMEGRGAKAVVCSGACRMRKKRGH